MYNAKAMQELVGKKVKGIGMTEDYLRFITDDGNFTFEVSGDCCSHSFFYDFIGVKKLLENGPIKLIEDVDKEDDGKRKLGNDSISCYGVRFVTEDPKFGEVSSVMSFRNDSNGYYGGSLEKSNFDKDIPAINISYYSEIPEHLYV
jgi:hypothetical protein